MWLEDFVPPLNQYIHMDTFEKRKVIGGEDMEIRRGGVWGDEAPQKIDDKKWLFFGQIRH